jgi:hypothetical protein
MAKSRTPIFRALVALGAQVLSGGAWAVIAPTSLAKAAPYLIIVGVLIIAIAYFWDEVRGYWRWKRGPRHLYVSYVRERLPIEGPRSPFRLYHLTASNPPSGIY